MNEHQAQQQLQMQAGRETRRRLENFASRIGVNDGTNREGLREWIQGIDSAKGWTTAPDILVLEMAAYLSSGSLASLIRNSVDGQVHPTWDNCKTQIINTFLNADEQEYLRSRVDNLVQNAYEDSREYARRFQEAVDKGYSTTDLGVDLIKKRLISLFINGLRDKQIRTYVHLEKPDTLANAYTTANNASRAVGKAECDARKVEPMEVGSLSPAAAKPPPTKPPLEQLVKTLQGEVKSLRKIISDGHTSAQAAGRPQPQQTRGIPRGNRPPPSSSATRGPRQPNFDSRGQPRCFKCNRYGHLARDCRQQRAIVAAVEEVLSNREAENWERRWIRDPAYQLMLLVGNGRLYWIPAPHAPSSIFLPGDEFAASSIAHWWWPLDLLWCLSLDTTSRLWVKPLWMCWVKILNSLLWKTWILISYLVVMPWGF